MTRKTILILVLAVEAAAVLAVWAAGRRQPEPVPGRDGEVKVKALKEVMARLRPLQKKLGHMFSMYHCTAYACNMCGSNSLAEDDRRPMTLCPECLAKVCWATQTEPGGRYRKLLAFCKANGLAAEAARYEKCLAALRAKPAPPATTSSRPAQ